MRWGAGACTHVTSGATHQDKSCTQMCLSSTEEVLQLQDVPFFTYMSAAIQLIVPTCSGYCNSVAIFHSETVRISVSFQLFGFLTCTYANPYVLQLLAFSVKFSLIAGKSHFHPQRILSCTMQQTIRCCSQVRPGLCHIWLFTISRSCHQYHSTQ